MRRLTITVDDEVFEQAYADVVSGRAASMSGWVADAMRLRLRARQELHDELGRMEAESPYTPEDIAHVAAALGRSEAWVAKGLGVTGRARRRSA